MKRINGYVKRHLGQGPNKVPLPWASERKEVEVALKLGGALWCFWSVRGYQGEGRGWLSKRRWRWTGEDRLRCGRWH